MFILCHVNNSYHHELASRPDVEEVWWHGELSVHWRHAQLHVGVRDVGLAVVEPRPLHHLLPHGGEGSVAANDKVGLDCHLRLFSLLIRMSTFNFI